jgi:hypothetical protein
MKIVVALNSLGIGGTESYALTVAEQLDRLAHQVFIYAAEGGSGIAPARERGLAIVDLPELPAECEAAIVQDAAVSLELAERRPDLAQLFVCHSETFDPQAPPLLPGVVDTVVALNDRVAGRVRSFAAEFPLVRLQQPIDTVRFRSGGALPEVPQTALLLSNNNVADREAMLRAAFVEAGIELVRVGGTGGQDADPRSRLLAADIVVGYGRSILEAMSCSRAAYVYDWAGGSGWITAESYPAIEAGGFAGFEGSAIDPARLRNDLARYSASMGPVNHDLVLGNHRANVHAQQLLDLLGEIVPAKPRPVGPLEEMARLVRLEWRARAEIHGMMSEGTSLRAQLEKAAATAVASDRRAAEAEIAKAREVAETARAFEATMSWQLTAPLRAIGQLLRRLLRR